MRSVNIDNKVKKRHFDEFKEEIDRLWKLEGIDWIIEKTKESVSKSDLKEIIKKDSFNTVLSNDPMKDRDYITKFNDLFTQGLGNKEILHNMLWSIMPESLRMLSNDIESWKEKGDDPTGKPNTWEKFYQLTGIRRQHIYLHMKGYHYPERDVILSIHEAGIITDSTKYQLMKELYGVDVERDKTDFDGLNNDQKIKAILELTDQIDDCSKIAVLATNIMNLYTDKCINQSL